MDSPESRSSGDKADENSEQEVVAGIMEGLRSRDEDCQREAAREIRRLTKTSSRHRRMISGAIGTLVWMLRSGSEETGEAAMLALLNLAVKDERNKIAIMDAGGLEPLIGYLRSTNLNLQEYATAALLTLTASSRNRPTIATAGVIPLLVNILRDGTLQAKIDVVVALHNLSALPNNMKAILSAQPIEPLISLLRSCKKSSKTADKCIALLELQLQFDEGRIALTSVEDGVLTVVEVLEEGSLTSRELALSALLTMCKSDPCRYREVILKEGVIPGLLELTVAGTTRCQSKARSLLHLLRDPSNQRSEFQGETLENIVNDIVAHINGDDRTEKAKMMLSEMVRVSMEQSLRHLQQRALACTPAEKHFSCRPSEVRSK